MPRYAPEDSLQSPRFTGPSTFARLPLVRDLVDVDVAVIGVPFDTGVTYRVGGRFGPNAVRAASVSFDIDVVDPAYAPGTGTPEAGGPSARDLLAILRGLTGIDFVGFDVVEVIPAHDPAGQTATLAANLAYEMLSLVALRRAAGAGPAR